MQVCRAASQLLSALLILKHLVGVAVEAVQPVGHVVEVLEVQPLGLAA